MPPREYDNETKAAVIADLLAGETVSGLARKYKIPKGTVSAWQKRAAEPIRERVANSATQKGDEIADLLMRLVEADLCGLIAIADHMTNREWLFVQDAAALGNLKGITHDKVMRMLEALEPSNVGSESNPT